MFADSLAAGTLILPLLSRSPFASEEWTSLAWPIEAPHMEPPHAQTWVLLKALLVSGLISATARSRTRQDAHFVYLRIHVTYLPMGRRPAAVDAFHLAIRSSAGSKAKITVGSAMRDVLRLVRRDVAAWECADSGPAPADSHFFDQLSDTRTLSEIFQDLPSPPTPPPFDPSAEPHPTDLPPVPPEPLGMRSTLHSYQQRTVALMLERELQPSTASDPRYVRVRGVQGEEAEAEWYLDIEEGVLRRAEDVQYESVRGGVLCEEMGSGKTCMCIALILSTKGRVASPPQGHAHCPAMTAGGETFPWAAGSSDASSAAGSPSSQPPANLASLLSSSTASVGSSDTSPSPFPSLRQLALHTLRTSPPGPSHLLTLLHKRSPRFARINSFVTHSLPSLQSSVFPSLGAEGSRPFYREGREVWGGGRETRGMIRAEKEREGLGERGEKEWVGRGEKVWLSALSLVVVPDVLNGQWKQEFMKHCMDDALRIYFVEGDMPSAEHLVDSYDVILMTQHRFSLESTRVFPPSPLLSIRFLRLIIDEGHIVSSSTTLLHSLASRLSVQARWVVTGTPTTHIKALGGRQGRGGAGWRTKQAREDLAQLGHIVSFLCCPPFSSPSSTSPLPGDTSWPCTVSRPLTLASGPAIGAVHRLATCLSRVLVRHRAEDIERDVGLPGVEREVVGLEMGEVGARTYNVLMAQVGINAVDSERTDQDYLFHPRNRAALALTMANLSQCLFWNSDNETDWSERVRTAEKSLVIAQNRGASESDMELMESAIRHLKDARDQLEWLAIMDREALPFLITGLPACIQHTWTRSPALIKPDGTALFEHDRLVQLRKIACLRARDVGEDVLDELVRLGEDFAEYEGEIERYVQGRKDLMSAGGKGRKKGKAGKVDGPASQAKAESEVMGIKMKAPVTSPSAKVTMSKSAKAEVEDWESRYKIFQLAGSAGMLGTVFPPEALMAQAQVGQSLSPKVNYIVSDILSHQASEKTLIFSSSPLSLAHLCDAFDIYQIKYLYFRGGLSSKDRDSTLQTFETSAYHRVLLMELKHGARGLNLVSASRVIFCEPVWKADEESQAIKRCHRIGQVRKVTVKTLVINGTHEAEAVRVRKPSQDDQASQAAYDVSIKDFMNNPRFLEGRDVEWPALKLPLLRTTEEEPALDGALEVGAETPKKKKSKKRVRVDVDDDEGYEGGQEEEVGGSRPMKDRPRPRKKARVQFGGLEGEVGFAEAPQGSDETPGAESARRSVELGEVPVMIPSGSSASRKRPRGSSEELEDVVSAVLVERPKKRLRFAPDPGSLSPRQASVELMDTAESSNVPVSVATSSTSLPDEAMSALFALSEAAEIVHSSQIQEPSTPLAGRSHIADSPSTPPSSPPLAYYATPPSGTSTDSAPSPVTPSVERETTLYISKLVDDLEGASSGVAMSTGRGKRSLEEMLDDDRTTELEAGPPRKKMRRLPHRSGSVEL